MTRAPAAELGPEGQFWSYLRAGKLMIQRSRSSGQYVFYPRYGLASPLPGYAMCAARHMHEYGTTREQMAEVAVAARQWAQLHPDATMKAPLTIDEVLASPMVADPLSRLDCCLMSDGGAAVIVTSPDRAKALRRKPVYFLGGAGASWSREVSQIPDFCTTPTAECAPRAFAMAGVSPAEVDVLQLYEAFTINVIMFLEDIGFCKKGEGGAFVAGGRIAPGGALPVNTKVAACHSRIRGCTGFSRLSRRPSNCAAQPAPGRSATQRSRSHTAMDVHSPMNSRPCLGEPVRSKGNGMTGLMHRDLNRGSGCLLNRIDAVCLCLPNARYVPGT